MVVVADRIEIRLDDEALQAQQQHLEHGGLFVPLDDPPAVMSDVVLSITTDHTSVELAAQLVQVLPDGTVGFVLADPEQGKRSLQPGASSEPQLNLRQRMNRLTTPEKQELAIAGDRVERLMLMKDPNKAIHPYLLRNPRLTTDEVRMMATYRNINPDVLNKIAQNREWMRDARIVGAVVGNPKAPPQLTMRLLDRLSSTELRRLAKSPDASKAVQRAARQKLHRV